MITEQGVVRIYLRYLPEDLGAQVRGLAPMRILKHFMQPLSSQQLEKTVAPRIPYYGLLRVFRSLAGT